MWGHTPDCGCGICACLPRVFALIALGNPSPGYVPWAADRLRLLEADLRDELQRRGARSELTHPEPAQEPAKEVKTEPPLPAAPVEPKEEKPTVEASSSARGPSGSGGHHRHRSSSSRRRKSARRSRSRRDRSRRERRRRSSRRRGEKKIAVSESQDLKSP